jgi:UDPglucose 6-dehydrogenase
VKISIVGGCGKIGGTMVAYYASLGHDVVVVDKSETGVKALKEHRCLSIEPGVPELMAANWDRITASTDFRAAKGAEMVIVQVPSPSDEQDKFVSGYVRDACGRLAEVVSPNTVVVVSSTLMPGEMDKTILPVFGGSICYSPVFVAIGNVLKGIREPDAVIIGQSSEYAGKKAEKWYRDTCANNPPIVRTSIVNAELAKLLLNCFITAKISLANSCAEICERVPGADADVVLGFLGLDKRIGTKTMKPGLGFGGTCFGRDSKALIALGYDLKHPNRLQGGIDDFNRGYDHRLVARIVKLAGASQPDPVIAFLGLTYKTDVDLVDDSNALRIAHRLSCLGIRVKAFDPMGMPRAKKEVPETERLKYCASVEECVTGADLTVLATPWPEFREAGGLLAERMRTKKVLDCWRLWDGEKMQGMGIEYHAVGLSDQT